jgi:muconolactone D-isomerase
MLYLVNTEIKDEYSAPSRKMTDIIEQDWKTILNFREEGKIKAIGSLVERKGCCGIWDVESIEELHQLVSKLPLYAYLDIKITPLITPEYALEATQKAIASRPSEATSM